MNNPQAGTELKQQVHDFWNAASCGEVYAVGDTRRAQLEVHARARYQLEPEILEFARFHEGAGRDVLEIGVGFGADHHEWAKAAPRSLSGVDLTPRAIEQTRERLALDGLRSDLRVSDAERLPFEDESFDLVYSWGVLHHSPDTPAAVREVHRVLRAGGTARVMIYHRYSIVGFLLWLRYALLAGAPTRSLAEIYATYLESPGTKAYTRDEGKELFAGFSRVETKVQLGVGDLLLGEAGQRHQSVPLRVAKRLWPRALIRRLFPKLGLMLLIEAVK